MRIRFKSFICLGGWWLVLQTGVIEFHQSTQIGTLVHQRLESGSQSPVIAKICGQASSGDSNNEDCSEAG